MKPLVLTPHAEVKLPEPGIPLSWVERTVREPDWTEPEPRDASAEQRFRAKSEAGDRVLRVVCRERDATIRVVTATLDRSAGRVR